MDEMIRYELHAILIKVAAMGLNEKHLGKSLLEMQSTLITLVNSSSNNRIKNTMFMVFIANQ